MAATGIPLAATNIFPFSIIGRDFGADPNLALYMGSLNIFIVLPQLLDTLYSGKVRTMPFSYVRARRASTSCTCMFEHLFILPGLGVSIVVLLATLTCACGWCPFTFLFRLRRRGDGMLFFSSVQRGQS